MTEKKSILFIHPFLPYPLESGGHQALFNGILAVKDDYDVYLAYEAWESIEYADATKEFSERMPNVHLLPLLHKPVKLSKKQKIAPKVKKILKRIIGLNDITPFSNHSENLCNHWIQVVSPLKQEWASHIQDICHNHQFDIIQVEMPWMIPLVLALPDSVKKIHVHHELGFVVRELQSKDIPDNFYVRACRKFSDMNEIGLLNLYDAVVTLSPIDAGKLAEKGVNVPIFSSFSIVDAAKNINSNDYNPYRLTFVGPDLNPPNISGLIWFLDNCWLKLQKLNPRYQLDIIGKWELQKIKVFSEKYNNIHFLGYVEDLDKALKGSVMIVPILVGSGIRMKILECASRGVPFISTTVGAEGIPVKDGEHCFITDDAVEFVDDIVKLQDIELQKKIAANSLNMINENYSLEALRKNRLAIYSKLLGNISN